ncbi:MAG: SDR family oxidoreductase [Treponema sp.]|jgi:all-trans-retinol dehydrogenase (NAD+)|nr:SDR family oxidoreductase [Treponema sp.]
MKDVKGLVALITGGGSGIGRLMAFDFAERGARVVVWDLNGEALALVEREAAERGLSIRAMICDVSRREDVYRQAEVLIRETGPVDMLINNAGIVSGRPMLETPDELIEKTVKVNILALFWTVKAFLPGMMERNSGHIINISSAAGLIGVRGLADYCASKFAVYGFNESIRMELRRIKSRVRTTVVCPFFIDTGMFTGVKTRFPLLLPILKGSYAAKKIVRAALKNKEQLIMPRLVGSIFILRLFPPAILDMAAGFLGINHTMDEFKGRI